MKQVLIINGHPDKESFNHALSSAYKEGLSKTTATVSQIDIAYLNFNPNLHTATASVLNWNPICSML